MCIPKPPTWGNILKQVSERLFRKKAAVPPELQRAIDECNSMQDLIELLFATDFILDEVMIMAFDQRFAELENGHALNVYQTIKPKLKTYNNGNRIV